MRIPDLTRPELFVLLVLALFAGVLDHVRARLRRRREINCSLCTAPLRPASPGEDASGFWYCGPCVLAMREARAIYSKLERRAS